jgi:hypothetical protein
MANEFNNPLSLQTIARVASGDYLMHLAEFREMERSVEVAREWANRPKHVRKGYFAQVLQGGKVVFDTRSAQ